MREVGAQDGQPRKARCRLRVSRNFLAGQKLGCPEQIAGNDIFVFVVVAERHAKLRFGKTPVFLRPVRQLDNLQPILSDHFHDPHEAIEGDRLLNE